MSGYCLSGPGPNYAESVYTLYRLANVDSMIPSNSGEITSCSSSPSLPSGLILGSDCSISGAPVSLQTNTSYSINASVSGKPGSTVIQIQVVSLGGNALGLIRTNQSLCYNLTTSISCGDATFPRQDGDFRYYLARGYEDKGDGTILDITTGLLWGKCTLGSSGVGCATGNVLYTYTNAVSSCQAIGMRLPSVYELYTIMDQGVGATPFIDGTFFPGTNTSTPYWTSTDDVATSGNKMTISFQTSSADTSATGANTRYVRCVRGDSISPSFSYVDYGNGTVKDKFTRLIWQTCSYGQSYPGCSPASPVGRTWQQALNECNSLGLAGRSWRLPNKNELLSLTNYGKTGVVFDSSFFPNSSNVYWSSTTNASANGNAFIVNSNTGITNMYSKAGAYSTRCVSGP